MARKRTEQLAPKRDGTGMAGANRIIWIFLGSVAALVFVVIPTAAWWYERDPSWTETNIRQSIQTGDLILTALEQYHQRHGQYPGELVDLVTEQLPTVPLPSAGGHRWIYSGGAGPDSFSINFCDRDAKRWWYHNSLSRRWGEYPDPNRRS